MRVWSAIAQFVNGIQLSNLPNQASLGTDSTGKVIAGSATAAVPIHLTSGTYTVSANTQAVFHVPIQIDSGAQIIIGAGGALSKV